MLEESDAGDYTCVATNVAGSDECSAPLTVRGQLKPQENRTAFHNVLSMFIIKLQKY